MAKPKVYVSRPIPEAGLQRLRQECEVVLRERDEPATPTELRAALTDCQGLVAIMPDRIDEALLDAAPLLKVVANHAVGVDNIDLAACRKRGVAVGNTPDVLTDSTADVAWTLLMASAWRVPAADRKARDGSWGGWKPTDYWGTDVAGSTLGIVGFGRIGQAVARRAAGFGMELLFWNRSARPELEKQFAARQVALDEVLRSADFISINCALTPETKGLIGTGELRLMKQSAILVNTARGAIVDQAALALALQNGTIRGAGLDVFETEPLPLDDPLVRLPNVVLMPHIGSATEKTRSRMALLAAENIIAGVQGRPLPHPV